MKKLFLILLMLGGIVRLSAQQSVSFVGSWEGDTALVRNEQREWGVPMVATSNRCWLLDANGKSLNIHRRVRLCQSASTVWCSFLAAKSKGNQRFGVFFKEKGVEKAFIPIQRSESVWVVVRIDYSDKGDKAYVFYNPNVASVPDLENAEYVSTGDFSFDTVGILAETDTEGRVSQLLLGDNYQDILVASNKSERSEPVNEGNAQTVLSWETADDALWIRTSGGILYLQPYATRSVHVLYGKKMR